jgi:hypothetical protein
MTILITVNSEWDVYEGFESSNISHVGFENSNQKPKRGTDGTEEMYFWSFKANFHFLTY